MMKNTYVILKNCVWETLYNIYAMPSISDLEFSLTFESSHEINFHFIKNIPSSIFDVLKIDCIV